MAVCVPTVNKKYHVALLSCTIYKHINNLKTTVKNLT